MSERPGTPLPRAVLDSDVIFSRVLHELMGRVAAQARLMDLLWSEELLAEAARPLRERKGLARETAERWVGRLRDAFPEGRVEIAEAPPEIPLSALTRDPGDHHVCALVLAGSADYLLTFDRGYLRQPLVDYGVEVISPDDFLSARIDEEPEAFLRILAAQAAAWGGGRSVAELIDAIARANAPVFAGKARLLTGN